jgi:hypothetical protein
MTEEPKIQHIDSIPAQHEEAHVERLAGDLVCRVLLCHRINTWPEKSSVSFW